MKLASSKIVKLFNKVVAHGKERRRRESEGRRKINKLIKLTTCFAARIKLYHKSNPSKSSSSYANCVFVSACGMANVSVSVANVSAAALN